MGVAAVGKDWKLNQIKTLAKTSPHDTLFIPKYDIMLEDCRI